MPVHVPDIICYKGITYESLNIPSQKRKLDALHEKYINARRAALANLPQLPRQVSQSSPPQLVSRKQASPPSTTYHLPQSTASDSDSTQPLYYQQVTSNNGSSNYNNNSNNNYDSNSNYNSSNNNNYKNNSNNNYKNNSNQYKQPKPKPLSQQNSQEEIPLIVLDDDDDVNTNGKNNDSDQFDSDDDAVCLSSVLIHENSNSNLSASNDNSSFSNKFFSYFSENNSSTHQLTPQQQQQSHQQQQQQQQQSHQQRANISNFTNLSNNYDDNNDSSNQYDNYYQKCLNDNYDSSLNSHSFPHSPRLRQLFEYYFKFKTFRTNQLEAINAACLGLDTLILMPTGGGKSICYQLPAVVCDGLTIVVSPLKSLIEDQVNKLRSLNITTSKLSAEMDSEDSNFVYKDLRSARPTHKMLYVTPEKIGASGMLMSLFESLYGRGLLSRFVIDEAHCVSMWGSDFRPDYRKLGVLRQRFPSVPIMALTATAPPKVRLDILHQLKMSPSSKVFLQSFNRPNLKFEVRKKSRGSSMDVACLIKSKFNNQTGIVYCLSRGECESVAGDLRGEGIMSMPYHAGLNDERRRKIFKSWEDNQTKVVCATIAFGMGIDKANVRFVIHFSMPKSIEGYYQEAGRAGRDGKFAHCVLFYSSADIFRMKSLLRSGGGRRKDKVDKDKDKLNLDQISAYCSNTSECRRTILLRYLGESFDRKNCLSNPQTVCDNCSRKE